MLNRMHVCEIKSEKQKINVNKNNGWTNDTFIMTLCVHLHVC